MTEALTVKTPAPVDEPATPIIVGPGNALHHLAVRREWYEAKRAELARAERAYRALRTTKVRKDRLQRLRERISLLRKAVKAMALGYVPIPRFEGSTLSLDFTELPSAALVAVAEAEKTKLFSEIRFVQGREESGRGRYRRRARDPLLVGILRTPSHRIEVRPGWPEHVPPREEHYLIAWWQPSDERDDDLF